MFEPRKALDSKFYTGQELNKSKSGRIPGLSYPDKPAPRPSPDMRGLPTAKKYKSGDDEVDWGNGSDDDAMEEDVEVTQGKAEQEAKVARAKAEQAAKRWTLHMNPADLRGCVTIKDLPLNEQEKLRRRADRKRTKKLFWTARSPLKNVDRANVPQIDMDVQLPESGDKTP